MGFFQHKTKLPPSKKTAQFPILALLGLAVLVGLESGGTGQTFNPDSPSSAQEAPSRAPGGGLDAAPLATSIRPQDVVEWQGFDATEDPEHKVTVFFRLNLKSSWKVYASNLKFAGPPGFIPVKWTPPPPKKFMDPISQKEVDVYDGGEFEVEFTGSPPWTNEKFPLEITYVGCTDVICLFPYTETLNLAFRPYDPDSTSVGQTTSQTSTKQNLPTTPSHAPTLGAERPLPSPENTSSTSRETESFESLLAKMFGNRNSQTPIILLLGIVFLGGLLSNLTPCVYPMIPITLRVLSRQTSKPYQGAFAYSLGIVLTYTGLGLIAAVSGGLFGSMLAMKPVGILFAILMAGLGLSMIGFGNFTKIQMLGQNFGSGAPSLTNAFAMGIGAGFVAAPCTGPILATLLAYTAKEESGLGQSVALLFTYSLGFGLPYMILGGAATKVSKIKVPPTIQIGVKLVFAAVMFALSFYYLRIPLYNLIEGMRGKWQPLAVAASFLGILSVGLWVSFQNLYSSKYLSIIPSLILGVGLFASSQWLSEASPSDLKVEWYKDETAAFDAAHKEGKHVLIDMWAEWCEACKKMDATTFQDPLVIEEIQKNWIPLKFDLTELDEKSEGIQTHYNIQSLPTLVLSTPQKNPANYQNIGGYVLAYELLGHMDAYLKRHPKPRPNPSPDFLP